jgi:type II secretory pathway pseudopilin PulG
MKQSSRTGGAPAFVMAELASVVLIVAVLMALLLLGSADSRRRSRLAGSVQNLQQIAAAGQSYSADSADRVWAFSWRAGIDYGFGGVAADDTQAAANQAVDIIRRRGSRPDLTPIATWLAPLFYSHLVLVDYLEESIPERHYVSPGDHNRLAWQTDPVNLYCDLPNRANYPSCGAYDARWPYSSSYELGIAFWCPDGAYNGPNGPVGTVSQAQQHNLFQIGGNTPMGRRLMSEVTFPSQKAMMWEQVQRFFGQRELFFAYTEARVPVMFADGSVSVRNTQDCNNGFNPSIPSSPIPSSFAYVPDFNWEPATANGLPSENVSGHMRWTRTGIRGRDFAGPEVQWSPP